MKSKNYRVLSLFAGAGGLDYGFKKSKFDIVWANDLNINAVETYKINIGSHIEHGDIRNIPSDKMPNNIDVVLGGFPCQGFSINNKNRTMEDQRNFLYKELLRVVKDKRPKIFIGENVKGLLSMYKGEVIKLIKKDFEKIGYKVNYTIVDMSEYGVPQKRERIFLYGNRIDWDNTIELKKKKGQTVKNKISYLSSLQLSYSPIKYKDTFIYNHIASTNVQDTFYARKNPPKQEDICDYLKEYKNKSRLSTVKIDKIFGYTHTAGHWFRKDNKSGSIPNVKDWWKLKEILNFDDRYDSMVTELEKKEIRFEQALRITNWDRPSDTITASQPEIHVNKERRLSVRECAILQTFPNDFIFTGSLHSMYRQVGNAVPPLFSLQLAESIGKVLETHKSLTPKENRTKKKN